MFAGRSIAEIRSRDPVGLMKALDAMPAVEKTSLFGTAVHAVLRTATVTADTIAQRLRASGLEVESVAAVTPSLEDVFLDVIDRAAVKAPGPGRAA